MLITFTCKSHADITMFGDVAKQLLKFMGHSGTVPGAIRPDDIPEALDNLERALAALAEKEPPETDDDEGNRKVTLSRRAWPLIDLLKSAHRDHSIVMWEASRS
ncbi:MAG: DUF1840 domain-containing protein [Proteobacteria bacterium]|nr:MAG: DUF1840 domain-containing protein [Pseudomonadota bacterium]